MPKRGKAARSTRPKILEIDNHAKVCRILEGIAQGTDLGWYQQEVARTARNWLRLGIQHLLIARRLDSTDRGWRATVSRCYYAAYNVSKCVRYCVDGFVKFDADDHKLVGDLPKDFPDRAAWSTFLVELRQDRNFADYEPWTKTRSRLSHAPNDSVARVEDFVKASKIYLRKRGWV